MLETMLVLSLMMEIVLMLLSYMMEATVLMLPHKD